MRVAEWGPMVVETDVDVAVLATLKKWLPTYLSQAERERGLDPHLLARPKPDTSYANTLEEDDFPDGRLPAIIVTTAMLEGDPVVDPNGLLYGAWRVVVSAIVRGKTPREARAIAALFGGCVRRVLLDKQSLGGFAGELRLVPGGRVAPVHDSTGTDRQLAAGINHFVVFVDEIAGTHGGPTEPYPGSPYDPPNPEADPDTPYDPLAVVNSVEWDVEGAPINPPGS